MYINDRQYLILSKLVDNFELILKTSTTCYHFLDDDLPEISILD